MRNPLNGLRKEFENRVRLGIMTVLLVNKTMDFNDLKNLLEVTDGNLSSHLSALEKLGFINIKKSFVGKKPNTSYEATEAGKNAFEDHLNALEKIVKTQE